VSPIKTSALAAAAVALSAFGLMAPASAASGGGSISGVLTSDGTKPLSGCNVQLTQYDAPGGSVAPNTTTGADGTFALTGLADGDWSLDVYCYDQTTGAPNTDVYFPAPDMSSAPAPIQESDTDSPGDGPGATSFHIVNGTQFDLTNRPLVYTYGGGAELPQGIIGTLTGLPVPAKSCGVSSTSDDTDNWSNMEGLGTDGSFTLTIDGADGSGLVSGKAYTVIIGCNGSSDEYVTGSGPYSLTTDISAATPIVFSGWTNNLGSLAWVASAPVPQPKGNAKISGALKVGKTVTAVSPGFRNVPAGAKTVYQWELRPKATGKYQVVGKGKTLKIKAAWKGKYLDVVVAMTWTDDQGKELVGAAMKPQRIK